MAFIVAFRYSNGVDSRSVGYASMEEVRKLRPPKKQKAKN